ncbi:hypothetical protein RIR_jg40690.t1 [Rhizophagus irregularis DAOM 181602=DAOM 197198]|nr:hypothetical protein RIR_jg40690.t1 [Rhizophagus irregularis DAOM 181602=DAOM 197198]
MSIIKLGNRTCFRSRNLKPRCSFAALETESVIKSEVPFKVFLLHRTRIRSTATCFFSTKLKKILIENLIEAFAIADIPLEKVNCLLPFFKLLFDSKPVAIIMDETTDNCT